MSISHFKIAPALLLAAATQMITVLVSIVPAWAPEKQLLVTIAGTAVTLGGLVANAVHKLADSNVSARDVEQNAIAVARGEVAKVDFNSLVQQAVTVHGVGDVKELARAEVQRALSGLSLQYAPTAPATTIAPAVAPAPPQVP